MRSIFIGVLVIRGILLFRASILGVILEVPYRGPYYQGIVLFRGSCTRGPLLSQTSLGRSKGLGFGV